MEKQKMGAAEERTTFFSVLKKAGWEIEKNP